MTEFIRMNFITVVSKEQGHLKFHAGSHFK